MPSAEVRPRFGVFLPSWVVPGEAAPSAAFLQDFARRAEDVGFDGVWVFDHLFEAPPSYRVVFMEPLTSLALVVGATRRVTLGTGILILPLRDPVVTAKAIANLDAVSGGRVVFGVGVGWDDKEFRACQVPKETRGRRTDEMLEIINGLWTQDTYAYDGRYFTIPEIRLEPRPIQTPRPAILIAGGLVPSGTSRHITSSKGYTAQRSLQRAATFGDGLMTAYRSAPGLDMSQLMASWDIVCAEARAAGRDPRSLRFAHQDHMHIDLEGTPERLAGVLARFSHNRYEDTAAMYLMGRPEDLVPRFQARIDAGVDEIAFSVLSGDPAQLDLFMKEIHPHLRPRVDRATARP
ncbi:MAG TPA: LLM class flavin-dependent oxidoreductase [Gemmatimonadales bacterium]|nr:LLM class flavin-dependent oxidoreductase [Gemmatimonadales bacterium]